MGLSTGSYKRSSRKKGGFFLISCSTQEMFNQSVILLLYLYSYLSNAGKKKKKQLHKLVLNHPCALILTFQGDDFKVKSALQRRLDTQNKVNLCSFHA